jgi:hypothetical protein
MLAAINLTRRLFLKGKNMVLKKPMKVLFIAFTFEKLSFKECDVVSYGNSTANSKRNLLGKGVTQRRCFINYLPFFANQKPSPFESFIQPVEGQDKTEYYLTCCLGLI